MTDTRQGGSRKSTGSRFDIVVIGGGPAGIAAATVSAEAGRSVVMIDESPRPGGQIWRHVSRNALPRIARIWLHRLDRSGAKIMCGTSVSDVVRHDAAGADARFAITCATQTVAHPESASRTLFADSIIIATGARERFIPFPGWTLTGVFGVGGAQALLKAGASMYEKRVVIAGSGPLLFPVAAALSHAGARVTHIVEQATTGRVMKFGAGLWRTPSRIAQALAYRAQFIGARYVTGSWVAEAEGVHRVQGVRITNGLTETTESCDLLCVGYGLVPSTEIAALLGCATDNGVVTTDTEQRTSIDGVFAAGESTGVAGVGSALLEGELAAQTAAASAAPSHRKIIRSIARERAFAHRMDVAFEIRDEIRRLARNDTVICRCEDVTLGAIKACSSAREAKLHTRAGMGPCQGRVCGPALNYLMGWSDTSVRPPAVPVPISSLITDIPAAAGGAQ